MPGEHNCDVDFLAASGAAAAEGHLHAQSEGHTHEHQALPSDPTLRVKALESLLVEKGLVDPAALDALDRHVRTQDRTAQRRARRGAGLGRSRIQERLLADAPAAIAEAGLPNQYGEHMVVVENTPKVHNLVVCTLCSCYPWPVLGLPPVWYKSAAYRSRAVIDPRGVLREFGTELPEDVEVRVWDSTAELRYLVLPERPAGTEKLNEEAAGRAGDARCHDGRGQGFAAGGRL